MLLDRGSRGQRREQREGRRTLCDHRYGMFPKVFGHVDLR
jgi:hypothetical protein